MVPRGHRWRLASLLVVALAAPLTAAETDSNALFDLRVGHEGTEPTSIGAMLKGSPALITFWATYCAPCRAEVPVIARAARLWAGRGVRVMGIAVDVRDPLQLKRATGAWGITYETLWLPPEEAPAASRLLPAGVPTTFLVGRRGVHRLDRVLSTEDLERTIPEQLDLRELPPAGGG